MIYFESGLVQFPNHFSEKPTKLNLINEMTSESVIIPVTNTSSNPRYYEFDFTGVELKNGTYQYVFGKEVGLLQVGDYVSVTPEYNEKKNNVVYER